MTNNITSNQNDAENLVSICLKRCGVERNIKKIIEALEEQIYGNYTAINADTFVASEDYQHMTYGGVTNAKMDIVRDGVLNRNIDCHFTDEELKWLLALSIDNRFTVDTHRTDDAKHNIKFAVGVPKSPTNLSSEKIRIIASLRGVNWNSATFHMLASADTSSASEVSKVLTLYLLS